MMIALHTYVMVVVALMTRGPHEGPVAVPDVASTLAALKEDKAFADLTVGVAARCVETNATVTGLETGRLMNPASGTKLLTTAAALGRFGASHRFETSFFGQLDNTGHIKGPLVIRPAGDPALQGKAFAELAAALKAAGIKVIADGITIDLSAFPDSDLPPAFDQKNTDAAYRPAVPPFGTHDGALQVTVKPGQKVGDPVVVTTQPAGRTIEIVNEAMTVAGKGIGKLDIRASGPDKVSTEPQVPGGKVGITRITVRGELGVKAATQGVRKRLHDPLGTALDEFLRAVRKAGINVDSVRVSRSVINDPGPNIGGFSSETVAMIVAGINIHSNNYWAEALFRLVGRPKDAGAATWAGATAAVTAALAKLGLTARDVRIVNGSGLYDATRITPEAMTRLLSAHGGDDANGRAFRDSLARAGESGTLKRRLKQLKGRMRGKTGTLDKAVSLSGFIDRPKGCRLAFAAIVEGDFGARLPRIVGAIDRWVIALSRL